MSLNQQQFKFTEMTGLLIQHAYFLGYTLSYGDARATTGHIPDSFHYKGLAVDFNLFKDGVYLTETEDHRALGLYWESLGGSWGGRFKDGNHYSLGE